MRGVMMSKRQNVFYLQKARVCVDEGRAVYWNADGDEAKCYNIPDKNTSKEAMDG